MIEQKRILRDQARKHRSRLVAQGGEAEAAARHFFDAIAPPLSSVIAFYWPLGREFDTLPLLERAVEAGYACVLPVINPDSKILKFARWDGEKTLVPGSYGILQPCVEPETSFMEPDIVITPLLAFDRKGYRLGQGGGYYDATLQYLRSKKKVLAVGLAYAVQAVLFNLPVEAHDEPLDWVVTEQGAEQYR
ncbi:MAG: 5-formyltetrahydrofolate cyclo-ligase [Alphaproteobacteria bacterium]|nr:5-formyltetrahydrofolate cyclo-ligase [Alphaproteobacteria bacterium]